MPKTTQSKKATIVAKRDGITLTLAFGYALFSALTEARDLAEQGWQTTVERHLPNDKPEQTPYNLRRRLFLLGSSL